VFDLVEYEYNSFNLFWQSAWMEHCLLIILIADTDQEQTAGSLI
jgi:hypothetical protein